jgi:DNA gyrase subunit A
MAAQLLFTEAQADAILEMRLYKLIGLELEALIKEHEETVANIYRYEDILESHESMSMVIQNELVAIKKEYHKARKTVIDNRESAVYEEKPVEEMDVAFIMDRFGYAKTIDASTYEKNKETIQAEFKYSFIMKNTGKICFFTNTGNLHTVKAMDLPQGKMRDKGIPIDNVSNFDTSKETIIMASSQSDLNLYRLLFTTKNAMMKVVDGGEFDVSKRTVAATKLMDNDEVVSVEVIKTQKTLVLRTNDGYFLRFLIDTVPEKKKAAVGVRGMRLTKNDYIRDVFFLNDMEERSIEHNGKELHLGHLKITSRDTKGTKVRL